MDKVIINLVYAHLRPDFISSMSRGDVLVINTRKPVLGCAVYVYMDAFSFCGRQPGLNVLFITEPTIVLPGQYNEVIWKQFDRVVTLCDELVEKYGFTKGYSPHQGFHPWFGESRDFIITEGLDERIRKYPLRGRKQAVCMVSGNKHSSVPGELYSKRLETALWFHFNSDMPFDVYGMVPFFLPNYRGAVENNKKLDLLSSYKYSLSFENTADPVFARGWVDKLIDSLETRTIPIYLGCPNIDEYIPGECYIDFRDFKDHKELDAYLHNMSESEYIRRVDSIDSFINSGGLRPYSWYPLYNELARYYSEQAGVNCTSLFGGDSDWKPTTTTLTVDVTDASPLWTYEELASLQSPLIDYRGTGVNTQSVGDEECIRRVLALAKEGKFNEAVKRMAELSHYRSADLFCFYAQLLRMLGHVETEKTYLALALQFDPKHVPTLKQMRAAAFDRRDFERALSRFEATITGTRIETAMVPGLTSIVIPAPHLDDTVKACLESIVSAVAEPFEVIVSTKGPVKTPGWLQDILSGSSRFKVIGTEYDGGYAALCNSATLRACGQYILVLDARGVMLEETLTGMLECINRHPEHGIAVPVSNRSPGVQQIPRAAGLSVDDFRQFAATFRQRNRNRYVPAYEIDGACILIKRSLLDTIGLFNEELEAPYSMVNDLRMRALVAGQRTMIASDTCIYLNETGPCEKSHERLFNELWDRFDPYSGTGRRLLPFVATKNARDSYGKGLLNEAIQAIMEGIKYTPEEPDLYYCLAEILMDAKLYGQAMEALQSLPDTEKGFTRALEMLGYCQYHTGHTPEADNYADQALSLCFDSIKGLNLKGMLASELGDREKAEAFFLKAIGADPGFADPYVNLGVMKWHAGETREALDLIEKGFILSPQTADFSATYNSAVTAMGEFPRAETVLLEAARLFPIDKQLAFLLTGVLLQQEKHAEAMGEIERSMITFGIDDGILAAALKVREKIGPEKLDKAFRKGSLSVCMIVKNEEEQIARCLASLKPVADEIIIADTGSTDRTRDICRAFGAHVHDFAWTNNFSEARNFSMSKAKGQWVLIHDADEVISPRDYGKLRAILSQDPPKPVAYSLVTRNYSIDSVYEGWTANAGDYPGEEAGRGWFPSPKVRLLINDERLRFENPIHELLEPSLKRAGAEIKACDVVIHHYGPADPKRGQTKAEMYYVIGKKKLETDGDTEAALRELAVQARAIGRYDESIDLWRRYITVNPGSYLPYFNMSGCYFEKEEFDKAFRHAKKAFELNRESKEAVQCYAVTSLFRTDPGDAIRVLEDLLKRIPPYPTGKMTLAAAFCVTGLKDKGFRHLKELKDTGYDCSEVLCNLSKKFLAAGKAGSARALLECMQETGHIHVDGARLLQESCDALALEA
jgi:glycosyltransferase involved in cell wall biosynthesis